MELQTPEVNELSKQIKEKLKEADESGMFVIWPLFMLIVDDIVCVVENVLGIIWMFRLILLLQCKVLTGSWKYMKHLQCMSYF